jgi:hypothetical protein
MLAGIVGAPSEPPLITIVPCPPPASPAGCPFDEQAVNSILKIKMAANNTKLFLFTLISSLFYESRVKKDFMPLLYLSEHLPGITYLQKQLRFLYFILYQIYFIRQVFFRTFSQKFTQIVSPRHLSVLCCNLV